MSKPPPISGLKSHWKRQHARDLAKDAAYLTLRHAPAVHYTQGGSRWQGIDQNLRAYRGQYPTQADCSSFFTWCLWNGLVHYGVGDTVNGQHWRAGYTGTMLENGRSVRNRRFAVADGVIYGSPGSTGAHTAFYVGGGKVISHGSEGGPYLLPWNYRGDVQDVRRYV